MFSLIKNKNIRNIKFHNLKSVTNKSRFNCRNIKDEEFNELFRCFHSTFQKIITQ